MTTRADHDHSQYHHDHTHYKQRGRGFQPELKRERSFIKQGAHNQLYDGREQPNRMNRRGAASASTRGKPSMELYRPPSMRMSTAMDPVQYAYGGGSTFNVGAPPFMLGDGYQPGQFLPVNGYSVQQQPPTSQIQQRIQHSKSSGSIQRSKTEAGFSPRVHFNVESSNRGKACGGGLDKSPSFRSHASIQMGGDAPASILKRSKSLGAADMRNLSINDDGGEEDDGIEIENMGCFRSDVRLSIQAALHDPNKLNTRSLMDLVRHIFNRLVESTKYAEPAAKLCITIIEREKTCTFLESLLNTCREWFTQRDSLLRTNATTYPAPGGITPPSPRWIAFINFLNEMYSQLKRREIQKIKSAVVDGVPPGIVLLSLLCECCQVSLKAPTPSLSETECLFFVLTSIGRDIEQESPGRLQNIVTLLRDAFLSHELTPPVRKTLLQLIELQAAKWQLPGSAVMYYYPSTIGGQ